MYVPDRYSLTDVAAFTRWYLSDYPVQVRVREGGLLVAGGPKGSTWKHPFVLDMDVLKTIPFWFAGLFLLALLLHDNPPPSVTVVLGSDGEWESVKKRRPLYATVRVLPGPTADYPLLNSRTTYYVCRAHACLPPSNTLAL